MIHYGRQFSKIFAIYCAPTKCIFYIIINCRLCSSVKDLTSRDKTSETTVQNIFSLFPQFLSLHLKSFFSNSSNIPLKDHIEIQTLDRSLRFISSFNKATP